jgi:hypothetical protein
MQKQVVMVTSHDTVAIEAVMDRALQEREYFPGYDIVKTDDPVNFMAGINNNQQAKIVFFLSPSEYISGIRKYRKDIFLVGFSCSSKSPVMKQYGSGLKFLKSTSCNLVLSSDSAYGFHMVIVPEEARYPKEDGGTNSLFSALKELLEITQARSQLTFTRSKVVDGSPVDWYSDLVPPTLRYVVDHCIQQGVYKPVNGATAGHFAVKLDDKSFLTSIRKTDFNQLKKVGLVKVVLEGDDNVIAYGAKPSVGGQSQRTVFRDHPEMDCIVHFHCPKRPDSEVPTVSQREVECGSLQCGQNTSRGLKQFGNLKAVYLDEHGPNIVFNRLIHAREVINFIHANFDLKQKTGGTPSFLSPFKLDLGIPEPQEEL